MLARMGFMEKIEEGRITTPTAAPSESLTSMLNTSVPATGTSI
jgi:hypothetical protein